MSKVYILFEYDYDYSPILGVYGDSNKAEIELAKLKDLEKNKRECYRISYGVEEHDVIE